MTHAVKNYDTLRAYMSEIRDSSLFVLTGSAVLAARGVRDVNDLDVLIRPELWGTVRDLNAKGYWPTKPIESPRIGTKGVHIPDTDDPEYGIRDLLRTGWMDFGDSLPRIASCVTVDQVFKDASVIDGYQIMSLRHCLAIKALANRPKDGTDMQQLAYLITTSEER